MTQQFKMTSASLVPPATVDTRPSLSGLVRCAVDRVSTLAVFLLTLLIRGYQLTFSPAQTFLFGSVGGCRYTPSCSNYALDALREHGAAGGTVLAVKRICRCHPWGGCGHDPVPPKNSDSKIRTSKSITL
jgi:putative membrane protein insertion efficiency factor